MLQPYTQVYQLNVDFFVHRIINSANAFLAYHATQDPRVGISAAEFCLHFTDFWDWFEAFDSRYRARTYTSRKRCDDRLKRWCGESAESEERLANIQNQTGLSLIHI